MVCGRRNVELSHCACHGGRYDPVADRWTPTFHDRCTDCSREPHRCVDGEPEVVWAASMLDTGGQYNPSSDVWTPTSMAGAPSARSYFTAVWTGSRMVVWGGRGIGSELATGGRYDPVSDSWTPTSMPAPRRYASFLLRVDRERVVGVGGYNYDPGFFPDAGGRYDAAADTWMPDLYVGCAVRAVRPHRRLAGSAMVVWGGIDFDTTLDTGGRYDPATDVWTPMSVAGRAVRAFLTIRAVWTGARCWSGAALTTTPLR